MNIPPAKDGGFGLRLKGGASGHSADFRLLSLRERVGVRGSNKEIFPIFIPLILSFSLREKGPSNGPLAGYPMIKSLAQLSIRRMTAGGADPLSGTFDKPGHNAPQLLKNYRHWPEEQDRALAQRASSSRMRGFSSAITCRSPAV